MTQKRKAATKQSSIMSHALPLLKKPMEAIGKQIKVPGSYWQGRMTDEERQTLYMCTVRDFTLANVEQIFSRAGALSDPNMNSIKLGILVMVGVNKKNYKPPVKDIKELYYRKFRGQGDSLDAPDEDDPALQ